MSAKKKIERGFIVSRDPIEREGVTICSCGNNKYVNIVHIVKGSPDKRYKFLECTQCQRRVPVGIMKDEEPQYETPLEKDEPS